MGLALLLNQDTFVNTLHRGHELYRALSALGLALPPYLPHADLHQILAALSGHIYQKVVYNPPLQNLLPHHCSCCTCQGEYLIQLPLVACALPLGFGAYLGTYLGAHLVPSHQDASLPFGVY